MEWDRCSAEALHRSWVGGRAANSGVARIPWPYGWAQRSAERHRSGVEQEQLGRKRCGWAGRRDEAGAGAQAPRCRGDKDHAFGRRAIDRGRPQGTVNDQRRDQSGDRHRAFAGAQGGGACARQGSYRQCDPAGHRFDRARYLCRRGELQVVLEHGTYLVATLLVADQVNETARLHPDRLNPPSAKKAFEVTPLMKGMFAGAYKAGVKIAFGTDTSAGHNAHEFTLMVGAG